MNDSLIEETLDPDDWEQTRALAHKMIDDSFEYLQTIRDKPVWQEMPKSTQENLKVKLPEDPTDLQDVYQRYVKDVMPYPMGNIHPRFWMWYMGSSNVTGALGDFLAAMNGSNLGGGHHSAALVDKQVVNWCKQMMGFPDTASGTLVSGGSMANFICLTVARNVTAGIDVRAEGVAAIEKPLRFYASDQVHGCHKKALEVLGMGRECLVLIKSGDSYHMDIPALQQRIEADRAAGFTPACVIATAGTVNTGAVDDLEAIEAICRREKMWFHVDGCIGALLNIAPENRYRVSGIEKADSVALDPHKWLHAPFEVGCAIINDAKAHLGSFTVSSEYLEKAERGIASSDWLHDYGMQTTRGFRALKVWFSMQEHGVKKFGRLIDQNISQARYLTELIEAHPDLELMLPTNINIVCYRYNPVTGTSEAQIKKDNMEIMLRLQEAGTAAVSDTTIHGRHCLRVAINNHRTRLNDLDILVSESVRLGKEICD